MDGIEKIRSLKTSVWVPTLEGTGTKNYKCPFQLKDKKLPSDDDWMLEVVCGMHNHRAADYLEGHSYVSRLSEEEYSSLKDMSKSNVPPKDILVVIKKKIPSIQLQ